jgi:hypothetical protein
MNEPRGLNPYDLPTSHLSWSPEIFPTPLRTDDAPAMTTQQHEEWRDRVTEWFIASMEAAIEGRSRPVFDATLPTSMWQLEQPTWIVDPTPEGIAAWCLDEIAKRDDLIKRLRAYVGHLRAMS